MVGLEADNLNEVPAVYKCIICSLILKNPHQIGCGHRICESCLDAVTQPTIRCLDCQEETPKNEIMPDKGARNDMKTLDIDCNLCRWKGKYKDYEDHRNQVHINQVCPLCNTQYPNIDALEEHKIKECPKVVISCPLHGFGCISTVTREELPMHYLTTTHQQAIMNFVKYIVPKVDQETTERIVSMETDTLHSASNNNDAPVQDMYETINIIAKSIQTLRDETERLNVESISIQRNVDTLVQDLSTLKMSVQEQGASIDALNPNQEVLQQDLLSIKQKIDDSQNISYDGTLTWKITNVREKMMDAQSERQTSIYSPPFYSSPTGYKMRARLYLHGDGNARRTHMSLFFVLMRGPNDAILKFPFNYKVTFCLYDQTAQQRHIIDSFRPDVKSNSFQRPRSEMNIASGIPKFFPLQQIQQEDSPYVRDDTMFIKVMVDFGDMPKTILPFALGLNPGFPSHVQQALVKSEIDKRVQSSVNMTPKPANNNDMNSLPNAKS